MLIFATCGGRGPRHVLRYARCLSIVERMECELTAVVSATKTVAVRQTVKRSACQRRECAARLASRLLCWSKLASN
jgi:hypothetical protein